MRAPRRLDRLYRNLCADRRLDELMLRYFGGKAGLAAASALLKSQRAIRIAAGKATKLDRAAARWESKREALMEGNG